MDNLDGVLVVDADGHVNEGDIDLAPWMPEKWRPWAPRRVKDERGHTRTFLEGRVWPMTHGPGPGVTGPFTEKARKGRPGMTNPVERLKDMDVEGIDVAVIFGTQIALTVNGLMSGELADVLCRAVNDWLFEYCSADPKRLRAVGLIPCQAPELAVKELERLANAGATSVMLPTNVYGRNMGDPFFHPIYEVAQEIGMTLSVHPQTGHDGIPGVSGVMGAGSRRFHKYVYVHMTAFPFELMIAMMHMMGEGIFDRYPRLRIAFMEGGASWLPCWVERFDEHREKLSPQMPDLKRMPKEIAQSEQLTISCESEETGLDRALEFAGAGTVLYASDYCHWDCHFPYSVKDIVENRELKLEQKKRVLGQNSVDFFQLRNLPEPGGLRIARRHWENGGALKEAAGA